MKKFGSKTTGAFALCLMAFSLSLGAQDDPGALELLDRPEDAQAIELPPISIQLPQSQFASEALTIEPGETDLSLDVDSQITDSTETAAGFQLDLDQLLTIEVPVPQSLSQVSSSLQGYSRVGASFPLSYFGAVKLFRVEENLGFELDFLHGRTDQYLIGTDPSAIASSYYDDQTQLDAQVDVAIEEETSLSGRLSFDVEGNGSQGSTSRYGFQSLFFDGWARMRTLLVPGLNLLAQLPFEYSQSRIVETAGGSSTDWLSLSPSLGLNWSLDTGYQLDFTLSGGWERISGTDLGFAQISAAAYLPFTPHFALEPQLGLWTDFSGNFDLPFSVSAHFQGSALKGKVFGGRRIQGLDGRSLPRGAALSLDVGSDPSQLRNRYWQAGGSITWIPAPVAELGVEVQWKGYESRLWAQNPDDTAPGTGTATITIAPINQLQARLATQFTWGKANDLAVVLAGSFLETPPWDLPYSVELSTAIAPNDGPLALTFELLYQLYQEGRLPNSSLGARYTWDNGTVAQLDFRDPLLLAAEEGQSRYNENFSTLASRGAAIEFTVQLGL